MNANDIAIIYPNLNTFCRFIGKGMEQLPVATFGFYANKNRITANIIRVINGLNLPIKTWCYGAWKNAKNFKTIILFDAVASKEVMVSLMENNTNARYILYMWNINVNKEIICFANDNGWEVWSFDKKESIQFGYKYNQQFYPNVKTEKVNFFKWDFFWVGYNKGRLKQLLELIDLFDRERFSYKIIVREWSQYGVPQIIKDKKLKKFLTYKETDYNRVINHVKKSKCLIDLVVEKQEGLTIRVLESLMYKKKLLTNNKVIRQEKFYNKNNIFVIGDDSLENLRDFIMSPYEELSENILAEYTMETWLKRFGKD